MDHRLQHEAGPPLPRAPNPAAIALKGRERLRAWQLTHVSSFSENSRKRTGIITVMVRRRESGNAAHQLCDPEPSDDENRRLFGKCVDLHGHNYVLEVVVAGESDPATGYVSWT
jgi:hypothetical protein